MIFLIIDPSDNSNSSCDSDQLQRSDPSYHGKSDVHQRGGIPVHRNESISISDMEKYATDVEVRSPVSLFKVYWSSFDYPDPFGHKADPGIPDKWNSPDNWSAYFSCLICDT